MKWDETIGCGFTSNVTAVNTISPKETDCHNSVHWLTSHGAGANLIEFIEKLTQLHKEPSFLWGKQEFMDSNSTNVFSFVRKAEGFDGFIVALHLNKDAKTSELVNFHQRHGISSTVTINQYFSFSGKFNRDLKIDEEITKPVLLSYGDVLILKYSN
jgi:hypothetical protein